MGCYRDTQTPTLTTVAQHGDKMGEVAAKMLIERIEAEIEIPYYAEHNYSDYRTEVIKATIIERESTGPLNR